MQAAESNVGSGTRYAKHAHGRNLAIVWRSPDSFATFNLQPKAGFLNCEIA